MTSGGISGPLSLSQAPTGWQSVLFDERRRSFVSIRSGAFDARTLAHWWELCSQRIAFRRASVVPRQKPLDPRRLRPERLALPRRAAWLTTGGCACYYDYAGTSWPPLAMPDWFLGLTEAVCAACGISDRPNSCNANLYDDGTECVGWHCDNEPLFDGVRRDALIVSLSLGAPRWFELCANDDPDHGVRVRLEDGDILTMEGLCQKHFRHCLPREPGVLEPRINLTWRWVVLHEESCPLHVAEDSTWADSDSNGTEEDSDGADEDGELQRFPDDAPVFHSIGPAKAAPEAPGKIERRVPPPEPRPPLRPAGEPSRCPARGGGSQAAVLGGAGRGLAVHQAAGARQDRG